MSYNCSNIKIISNNNFRIKISAYDKLDDDINISSNLPEFSLFEKTWVSDQTIDNEFIYVKNIYWCMEYSGQSWDIFLNKVLPAFEGQADLICIWEGGKDITGYRVDNGKVSKREVIQVLSKEIK